MPPNVILRGLRSLYDTSPADTKGEPSRKRLRDFALLDLVQVELDSSSNEASPASRSGYLREILLVAFKSTTRLRPMQSSHRGASPCKLCKPE
jgi:hypothetical protein